MLLQNSLHESFHGSIIITDAQMDTNNNYKRSSWNAKINYKRSSWNAKRKKNMCLIILSLIPIISLRFLDETLGNYLEQCHNINFIPGTLQNLNSRCHMEYVQQKLRQANLSGGDPEGGGGGRRRAHPHEI